MTSEQFAYWLQGFAELNDGPPSKAQWKAIREHLQTVFVKVTPQAGRLQTQCIGGQAIGGLPGLLHNARAEVVC